MKQLVPDRYAAARKDAREMVAWYRDNPVNILGANIVFLGRDADHGFSVHTLKGYASAHPLNMVFVASWARDGWRLADEALRQLITEHTAERRRLPLLLEAYSLEIMVGIHPRFLPGREKTIMRDVGMFVMVAQLVERHHLTPLGRNRRNRSACDLVAEALGEAKMRMSYDAVAKIWKRLQPVWDHKKRGTFCGEIKSHPSPSENR